MVVGKTNLHELAFGVTGINPWFGTPVNPLDARLVPGGSSSGSAVAVGAHEADVAFGSDTGGSIRIPAACCGVVGLKTTRGRVSLDGVLPLAPSLDTVGPDGPHRRRTSLAGMALLEPGFAPARPASDRRAATCWWGGSACRPSRRVDEAVDAALAAAGLRRHRRGPARLVAGHRGRHAHPRRPRPGRCTGRLWEHHADELSPDVSARLHDASSVTPADLEAAWQRARRGRPSWPTLFARVDVLALPVLAGPPPPLEDATRLTDIRYVAPFNLAGVPALALPVRAASPGVPPSLQLVGPLMSEERLVAIGMEVEAAAGGRD